MLGSTSAEMRELGTLEKICFHDTMYDGDLNTVYLLTRMKNKQCTAFKEASHGHSSIYLVCHTDVHSAMLCVLHLSISIIFFPISSMNNVDWTLDKKNQNCIKIYVTCIALVRLAMAIRQCWQFHLQLSDHVCLA